MAAEIERKFLVVSDAWNANVTSRHRIVDGIAPYGRGKVRIRTTADGAWITFKGPRHGITRCEYEYSIPHDEAEEMLSTLSPPLVVVKTRHLVTESGLEWAVDVHDEPFFGLTTAEVELGHQDQVVPLPSWVGPEVTGRVNRMTSALASWAQIRKGARQLPPRSN